MTSISLADPDQQAAPAAKRWPALLAFPLALLVLAASLGGLMLPAIYAGETPDWAAQGMAAGMPPPALPDAE